MALSYRIKVMGTAATLAMMAASAQPTFAAGTLAGTEIVNTVTAEYDVNNIAQTALTKTETVVVDRVINMQLTEVGNATTTVTPGATNVFAKFELTNLSNEALRFDPTVTQLANGTTTAHNGTDTFDLESGQLYSDTDGDGTFNVANDQPLVNVGSLDPDAKYTFFYVGKVPASIPNGGIAGVAVSMQASEAGTGVALVNNAGMANTAGKDTVFADGAGPDDAAKDAIISARDDFTVFTASLNILRTSKVVSNLIEGTDNPKAIPGATVEYCIIASNAADAAEATNVRLSDLVDLKLTYDSVFGVKVNGTANGLVCADDSTTTGTFESGAIKGTIPSIPAGESKTIIYRTTVN